MSAEYETGGYVYLLASKMAGTIYVGVTSNLVKRITEHREGITKGFTSKHKVHRLVYFEQHGTIVNAIKREKKIKGWKRAWKIRLIEKGNPKWDDLYPEIVRWDKA
jgi:putative endonuclease